MVGGGIRRGHHQNHRSHWGSRQSRRRTWSCIAMSSGEWQAGEMQSERRLRVEKRMAGGSASSSARLASGAALGQRFSSSVTAERLWRDQLEAGSCIRASPRLPSRALRNSLNILPPANAPAVTVSLSFSHLCHGPAHGFEGGRRLRDQVCSVAPACASSSRHLFQGNGTFVGYLGLNKRDDGPIESSRHLLPPA